MSLTTLGTVNYINADGTASPQPVLEGDLNLRRLEHLAVLHTPFFMLFLDLVRNKHCSFHQNKSAKESLANYVF